MDSFKTISQSSNSSEDDGIDLKVLMGVIWRGKLTIILSSVIFILLGGLYAYKLATPLYPAWAVVALETKKQNIVDIESVLSGGEGGSEEVNTELEVIRSRNIITKLVAELNLVNDPEFNEELRAVNPFHPVVLVKNILGIEGKVKTETEILNKVIDNVIASFSISNIRQSLVFTISVTTEEAKKSAIMANALAEIYIQDALDSKFNATEKAGKWLSEKAAELKQELESSELKIKEFSDGTQLINEKTLAVLSKQMKDMRQRVSNLNADREILQAELDSLEVALNSNDNQVIINASNDNRLIKIQELIGQGLATQLEFNTRVNDILIQLKTDLARSEQQYNAMIASEVSFSKEIDSQSKDLVELQQLEREAQANGLLYESFLSRLKETAVQKGLQRPDSRLLSSAVPRKPSSPRPMRILMLFMMLGAFLGAAFVIIKELKNNGFKTLDQLEDFSHLPVLGSIPKIDAKIRKDVLDYHIEKPTSVFAEAIRNLRTSILLSNIDKPPQVIMSTSSVPGEGKTTQSLTLAQNIAGLGKSVLVVEGDNRKRIFAEYFNIKNKSGFLAVMAGTVALKDAVFQHADFGVDILIGEKSTVNAVDIFSSAKFKDLILMLRNEYDYIIIDSAPVLAVPDARVIGQYVDSIIYSVLWNSTSKMQLKQGISMFESVGLKIDGLVLSNIDIKEMERRGYGGQYAYGDDNDYYES